MRTLHMLPLMVYEQNDLFFFLKSLQSPFQSFNIFDYMSFSLSSTHSFGTKLHHQFSCNNKTPPFFLQSFFTPVEFSPSSWPWFLPIPNQLISLKLIWSHFLTHFDSSNLCSYHLDVPAINVTLFLQSLNLTFNYTFLLLAVSIFNWLTFNTGLYIIQHSGLYTWLCVL